MDSFKEATKALEKAGANFAKAVKAFTEAMCDHADAGDEDD